MNDLRLVVEIPMEPPKEVNPNHNAGRRKRSAAVKPYRTAAALATVNAMIDGRQDWAGEREATLLFTIYWGKGRNFHDGDNALACTKAARDGIADAFGVDDKDFTTLPVIQARDPEGRGRTVAVVTARRKETT